MKLKKEMQNHAKKLGLKLNKKTSDSVLRALLKQKEKFGEIYCPCRVLTGDKEKDKKIICPCEPVRKGGRCICGLFENRRF